MATHYRGANRAGTVYCCSARHHSAAAAARCLADQPASGASSLQVWAFEPSGRRPLSEGEREEVWDVWHA